jgi:hypothetical protein
MPLPVICRVRRFYLETKLPRVRHEKETARKQNNDQQEALAEGDSGGQKLLYIYNLYGK